MNTHNHTTTHPAPKAVCPVCPFCGAEKRPQAQYIGGKGWITVYVCLERWDSDTCGEEVGK